MTLRHSGSLLAAAAMCCVGSSVAVSGTIVAAPLFTLQGLRYALAAVLLGVPVATVATYLSAAEPDLRERVLSTCPARLRRELEEELQVRSAASRGDFQDARRELLSRLRDEIGRRTAASPSPLNGNAHATERPAASRLVSA